MAHSLSAKKRVRQNLATRIRNKQVKSKLRSSVKNTRELIAGYKAPKEGEKPVDIKMITSSLCLTYSVLDKAAKGGIIHQKKASRLKSRLAIAVAKLGEAKKAPEAKAKKAKAAK